MSDTKISCSVSIYFSRYPRGGTWQVVGGRGGEPVKHKIRNFNLLVLFCLTIYSELHPHRKCSMLTSSSNRMYYNAVLQNSTTVLRSFAERWPSSLQLTSQNNQRYGAVAASPKYSTRYNSRQQFNTLQDTRQETPTLFRPRLLRFLAWKALSPTLTSV